MPDHILLNVTRVMTASRTNGPGVRAAVWVQGCTLACPGCFNPQTHPHVRRRLEDPRRLGRWMARQAPDGISILGGEPFQQAAACALLAEAARAEGASVMVWTGYPWPWLRRSPLPAVKALLRHSDALVAGPYRQDLRTDGRGWRGSSNQEVVLLTDRFRQADMEPDDQVPVIEAFSDGTAVHWSGIPIEPLETQLEDALSPPEPSAGSAAARSPG